VFYKLGQQLGSRMVGTLIGGIAYQLERCGVPDFNAKARSELGLESWAKDDVQAFETGFAYGEELVVEADAETGEGYDEAACTARIQRIIEGFENLETRR
jgi:hypothetical protein